MWDGLWFSASGGQGGFGGSLSVGNSPVGWMKSPRQVGEGFKILTHYGGPREWHVCQVADHSPLGPLYIITSCVSILIFLHHAF